MRVDAFLGGSYVAYSNNLAANRLVNLYAEKAADGGKSPAGFFTTPGTPLLTTVGNGPTRALHPMGNFLYVVSGSYLYKVDTSWSVTQLGSVGGSGPATMDDNGIDSGHQLFVACNPMGYIYNSSTNVFAQITDPDFPGAQCVWYLDGFFLFNQPGTQRFWITSLLDGTAVDPLDFASAEGAPDLLVALIVDHREAWMFGAESFEIFINTNNPNFPIERMQGAFGETGCGATYSVAKMDNTVFWVGNGKGRGMVWKAAGYKPERISTHAIEHAMEGYATVADAIGYTYQQQGHSFYVLTFPTGGATWVYDAAIGPQYGWHERAYLNPATASYERHRSNCHAYFNGKHVVGDYANGNLYALDLDTYADNGDPMKWLRSFRPGHNEQSHDELRIDAEVGVGLVTGQGSDPQMMLRVSDDGAYNWGREIWRPMGPIGARRQRVRWTRLGTPKRPHDRVYEVSGTEPVKTVLVEANLEVS